MARAAVAALELIGVLAVLAGAYGVAVLPFYYLLNDWFRVGPESGLGTDTFTEVEHSQRRRAARHAAGHLLVAHAHPACGHLLPVGATIRSRPFQDPGKMLVVHLLHDDDETMSDNELWGELVMAVAGHVAERSGERRFHYGLWCPDEYTFVRTRARALAHLGYGPHLRTSRNARALRKEALSTARQTLTQHAAVLNELAAALLSSIAVDSDEIDCLLQRHLGSGAGQQASTKRGYRTRGPGPQAREG
jgi:hypothetical protein